MKNSNNIIYDVSIRLIVLLVIIVWCVLILFPFINIILWSLILALALYPLHKSISAKLGDSPKIASFLIVIIALAIVLIPSWFLIDSLIVELKMLKTAFDDGSLSIPKPAEQVKAWPIIGERVFDFWLNASENTEQTILKYQVQLTEFGSKLFSGTVSSLSAIIQILASFIIASILLVFGGIGESIRKFFTKLAGNRGDEFADITMKTVSSVVKGILGVAVIVAILHGILFQLAGVPYAGIWALLVFILAVLQLPAMIITLPIIIYLFAIKSTTAAIIWTIFLVIIGLSDNVLKPLLLGKGAIVPMLVIFIGVLGGFILSGFIGLFTGAIILSLGYKLFMGWVNSSEELH